MRRVLHLKMVTQCAMLEDFGIFLVLADKVCCLDVNARYIQSSSSLSGPIILKPLFLRPRLEQTLRVHLRS